MKRLSTALMVVAMTPIFATSTFAEGELSPNANRERYALTVDVSPSEARVRIMNIKPKYHDGILLKPGNYHLRVDKRGFKTWDKWITMEKQEQSITVSLREIEWEDDVESEDKNFEYKRISGKYANAMAVGTAQGYCEAQAMLIIVYVFDEKNNVPLQKQAMISDVKVYNLCLNYASYQNGILKLPKTNFLIKQLGLGQ